MNVTRKLKGVELEPFLRISLFIWFDPLAIAQKIIRETDLLLMVGSIHTPSQD